MTPDQYCRQKAAPRGSSLYYSFLFLPPEKHTAVTGLFGFRREVLDVFDQCEHVEVAAAKLAWWREEIGRLFDGAPTHPVTRVLLPAISAYNLPRAPFDALIDGVEMDLRGLAYADFDGVRRYCYHVASTVGLLSARIFGYSEERTLAFAQDMAIAFQLTRIIRDAGEDALRGRVYVPQSDLDRFGVSRQEILQRRDDRRVRELMEFEVEQVRATYDHACAQLPAADRLSQLPSLIIAEIYRANLDEIARDNYRVLQHRVTLPALRKLWLAWKTARRERTRAR